MYGFLCVISAKRSAYRVLAGPKFLYYFSPSNIPCVIHSHCSCRNTQLSQTETTL